MKMKMTFNFDQAPSFARRELAGVAACAYASDAFPDLGFHDEEARHLARLLEVERAGFTEQELRPLAARARLVDDVAHDFFRRHPDGLAIGLFTGPSHGNELAHDNPTPPQILLYLESLWDFAEKDAEIFREEVRLTYLHELGHYFGWDEDELAARGLD